MDISLDSSNPEQFDTDCIVVGVYEEKELTPSVERLDKASKGFFSKMIESGDIEGKQGQTLLLHHIEGIAGRRVLLVGAGRKEKLNTTQFKKIVNSAINVLDATASESALFCLLELEPANMGTHKKIRHMIESAYHGQYRFEQLKSEKEPPTHPLKSLTIYTEESAADTNIAALSEATAISQGVALARDLGNLPGNICTPSYLAEQAKTLEQDYPNFKTTILDEKEMQKLGMGALLSVAKGSREPAKLIVMHYQGAGKNDKPHVLVGKGITFDAGGISIKPAAAMDEMKFDMCGAAGVIGTMKAVGELQPKLNIIGIVPSCENLPDGNANKPGDIVTSMSGQTIEILNTDAEGRLILCDALTYSEKFKPASVIDVATLTGACVVALGKHPAGLLGNNEALLEDIENAANQSGDRVWRMPLWEEYQEQLKSNFADMANIGGREAGTITAACFLSRFTKKLNWAHLDIAGVASQSGQEKGATGRPVALLTQYLLDRAK